MSPNISAPRAVELEEHLVAARALVHGEARVLDHFAGHEDPLLDEICVALARLAARAGVHCRLAVEDLGVERRAGSEGLRDGHRLVEEPELELGRLPDELLGAGGGGDGHDHLGRAVGVLALGRLGQTRELFHGQIGDRVGRHLVRGGEDHFGSLGLDVPERGAGLGGQRGELAGHLVGRKRSQAGKLDDDLAVSAGGDGRLRHAELVDAVPDRLDALVDGVALDGGRFVGGQRQRVLDALAGGNALGDFEAAVAVFEEFLELDRAVLAAHRHPEAARTRFDGQRANPLLPQRPVDVLGQPGHGVLHGLLGVHLQFQVETALEVEPQGERFVGQPFGHVPRTHQRRQEEEHPQRRDAENEAHAPSISGSHQSDSLWNGKKPGRPDRRGRNGLRRCRRPSSPS